MSQNKSVEEIMREIRNIQPMHDIVAERIEQLFNEDRQTSQDREREIVEEAIRLSDEAERGNETEFNEWRAFKGFRNGLRDWAKEKGITNPNKD